MSTSFLLFVAVFLAVLHTTLGLNCYYCNPGTDGCGLSSFNANGGGVHQISYTAYTYCIKYVSTSNTNYVTRFSAGSCPSSVTASNGADGTTVYCCATDLCNGTSMKSASILLALSAAALSFFYKK